MKKKTIKNYNSKGELHGYQERYGVYYNRLRLRGYSKYNWMIGYVEYHFQFKAVFFIN